MHSLSRIALALVPLLHLLTAVEAAAGIAVSPLQQRVVVKPGRSGEFSLTIRNVRRSPQDRRQAVKVEVVDFAVSSDGKLSFGEEMAHSRSAVAWITLDADEFVLDPGKARTVGGKVRAAVNGDGDYWAAVMVTPGGTSRPGPGVQVVVRMASGVFVHVARRNYTERGSVIAQEVILPQFTAQQNPAAEPQNEGGADELNQALRIRAELKNEGLVAFVASGTASLLLDGRKRVASVPLHASRSRILPGDVRRFEGVLATPLPAGDYTVGLVFQCGSQEGRKAVNRSELNISADLARLWSQMGTVQASAGLHVEPETIERELVPGRFTTGSVSVTNRGLGTVRIRCRLEAAEFDSDGSGAEGAPEGPFRLLAPRDWLALNPTEFTLAPRTQRSVLCHLNVPRDARPGNYSRSIVMETESAGLDGQQDADLRVVPVHITVEERM